MLKPIAIFFAAAILSACSAYKPVQEWQSARMKDAESGSISWSQYYSESYRKLTEAGSFSGKSEIMGITSRMIDVSRAYESGRLTRDQFEGAQRNEMTEMQAIREKDDARRQASRAAWARSMPQGSGFVPVQPYVMQPKPQINCTSSSSLGTTYTNCN